MNTNLHHRTLEIDLLALKSNVEIFKSYIKPTTKIMGIVKASGYGHGDYEIAKALEEVGVNYLGVATSKEAIDLCKKDIKTPILVMNIEEVYFDEIIEHKIEPSIYSFSQLELFLSYLTNNKIKAYPIHLKIDTGMHRLGFLKSEIDGLIAKIIESPELLVKGIFSHLAAADDEKEDAFTTKQLTLFEQISNKIENRLGYTTIKSILNSAGSERFPNQQFDMIRLGIGLFGVSNKLKLNTVTTFKTKISQLKRLKTGDSVGYGHQTIVEKETLIGIIYIGYADGFSRSLSNGKGSVFIKGRYAPVIGKVSMNMTTIDLTEIDGIKTGDVVEIFGKNRPINELAKQMNTIPYEVLTSLSNRIVRIYT